MPTQNCTYKSITLAAGEQFILPPGAEIVTTTNGLNDYTSTCPKPSTLETLKCYKFRFSGADGDSASFRRENWEGPGGDGDNFSVDGITLNDIYYPFSFNIQAWQDAASWTTVINSIPQFSGIFTNITSAFDDDRSSGANRGWTTVVTLTTISSIGDNMFFNISTLINDQSTVPDGSLTKAYVKGEIC